MWVERSLNPWTNEGKPRPISIIGGGLAGVEAAFQIAERAGSAILYEMRPVVTTPAHQTEYLSELVCSNSLKSLELTNAHGLLKEELRLMGSLIVRAADGAAIPGGKALVVDRGRFAGSVTDAILTHPAIKVIRQEVTAIPHEGTVIVASGPLTAPTLTEEIKALTGVSNLHFFDAVSPIIDGTSIDLTHAFFGARYRPESDDYLNCPLTKEEYNRFYQALIEAKRVDFKVFEKTPYFEGCLPIEAMAERGENTLVFGPMKPVGFGDRKSRPHAVLQLRREDASGTMYNIVGFQTKLTHPEQDRVFKLIPALRNAVFLRHGSIHRNTFINAPAVLDGLRLKADDRVFFAGQITGVEGYMESTAMGLLAGLAAMAREKGRTFLPPEPVTCTGALYRYISTERKDYQPMNVNFGLLDQYDKRKKDEVVARALSSITTWIGQTINHLAH
jgi:methylenetetrahydrofolate--tRNA-(uracil-5-)-methyltransferase